MRTINPLAIRLVLACQKADPSEDDVEVIPYFCQCRLLNLHVTYFRNKLNIFFHQVKAKLQNKSVKMYCITKNLGFTSHSRDEAIEVKWLAQGRKRGGLWRVSNPRWSGHDSDTLTTRPCRPRLWFTILHIMHFNTTIAASWTKPRCFFLCFRALLWLMD
jgi:hypothetical protein